MIHGFVNFKSLGLFLGFLLAFKRRQTSSLCGHFLLSAPGCFDLDLGSWSSSHGGLVLNGEWLQGFPELVRQILTRVETKSIYLTCFCRVSPILVLGFWGQPLRDPLFGCKLRGLWKALEGPAKGSVLSQTQTCFPSTVWRTDTEGHFTSSDCHVACKNMWKTKLPGNVKVLKLAGNLGDPSCWLIESKPWHLVRCSDSQHALQLQDVTGCSPSDITCPQVTSKTNRILLTVRNWLGLAKGSMRW